MSCLSGYLNKLSGKPRSGSYHKRYFVYSHTNCKLYYYRNSDEFERNGKPLGDIDISNATFSINTTDNINNNRFTIMSLNKQITVEANDHNECVEWLTKLESLRKTNQIKAIESINVNSQPNQCQSPSASKRIFNKIGIISRIGNSTKHNGNDCNDCMKCAEREDDLCAIQNELQASREVIKLLQQQLEIANNEKRLLQDICNSKSQIVSTDYLKYLTDSNEQITKLEIDLREKQIKCDRVENNLESVNTQNKKLKDEINVLQEMLESRDETVIQLTHQIFDLETQTKHTQNNPSNDSNKLEPNNELENLRDSVKAFVTQNEFLNREIIELNELRNTAEMRERESQTKICDLEAKCCQIQSKLLSLLKEIKQSSESTINSNDNKLIASNETVLTLVNRLMDETSLDIPLSWKPGNKNRNSSMISSKDINYDDLGFYYKNSDDNLDFLITNVDKVKIKNEQFNEKCGQNDHKLFKSWKLKWDSFVINLNNHSLQRTQELKAMLRSGIPQQYRCKIWKELIYMRIKDKFNDKPINYYQSLLNQNGVKEAICDPSIKQIELDLLRTLPHNKHFDSLESDGTCRLRRVLTAYSRHNQIVGYCQGLNRLAAVALLFMPEEDAFWCLVAIVETIMPPHYFGRNLLGAHVDQYVLRHLMAEKLPRLHYHLDVHQIELSLFSWFLTVFVDNIPVEVYLRIWDVFLYEGSKVLFRFALSLMKMHEQQLLQMTDSVSVNQFLRTLGERQCDLNQLSNIAFSELNPFPYRTVKLKRQYYYNLVKSDLEKLELIRQNLPNHDTSFDCESD